MSNQLFNELVNNNYLVINHEQSRINKPSKKRGSPLDRYRAEVLFFRGEMGCSYRDIAKWLSIHKDVHRSHTQIALKIRQWEQEYATTKNTPTKKV
ncbi:hypothetical protein ACNO5M_03615 [Vibrio owensii]|uniref:hypothetical protein n=1 Tax=Vibrio owensii TaxID=696485 RepID=UPI003AAC5F05